MRKSEKDKASKVTKRSTRQTRRNASSGLKKQLQKLSLSDSTCDAESEAECPKCGLVYGEDESTWIQCDACEAWWDCNVQVLTFQTISRAPIALLLTVLRVVLPTVVCHIITCLLPNIIVFYDV